MMKRIFLSFCVLGLLGFRPKLAQAAPTIVRCEPSTIVITSNDDFTVDLYVEDAADLYGLDVMLSFDETIATIVDVDTVRDGVQIAPVVSFISPSFVYQDNSNAVGSLRFAVAQANPDPPRTGEGSFARVTFEPIVSGDLAFNFVTHLASDRNGAQQATAAQDCDITLMGVPTAVGFDAAGVQSAETSPLLPTLLLLAGSLFLFFKQRQA